jgi:hypothetical protein
MPRYLVTTRRAARGKAVSALEAVKAEPEVTLLSTENPESVTHFVEPEIRRSLH